MYVYIVHAPDSPTFKFGISSQTHGKRLEAYKTAYGSFDAHVVACNNALEVESALKTRFDKLILPHDSGSPSEIVPRGYDDINLIEALRLIYATRTLSRRATFLEPVLGNDLIETDHSYNDINLLEENMDVDDIGINEQNQDEHELPPYPDSDIAKHIRSILATPTPLRLAELASCLLGDVGTVYYSKRRSTWVKDDKDVSSEEMHLIVARELQAAADGYPDDTTKLTKAIGKRSVIINALHFLQPMLKEPPLAETEDVVDALSEVFVFAAPFSTLDECRKSGFLVKQKTIRDAVKKLKIQEKLSGVSIREVLMHLGSRGYTETPVKSRFDCGAGVQNTKWIMGMKKRDPLALFLVEGGDYVDKLKEEAVRITIEKEEGAVTLVEHFLDAFNGWSQLINTSPTMNLRREFFFEKQKNCTRYNAAVRRIKQKS